MTLIELLVYMVAAGLSLRLGEWFFPVLGWWGVIPAIVLGFGSVFALLLSVHRLLKK